MKHEYRVVWKRRGHPRRQKRFANLATAERRVRLLGPEPWTAYPECRSPDDRYCCEGWQCGCEGKTWREYTLGARYNASYGEHAGMDPLEYVRIERRPLAPWEPGERNG